MARTLVEHWGRNSSHSVKEFRVGALMTPSTRSFDMIATEDSIYVRPTYNSVPTLFRKTTEIIARVCSLSLTLWSPLGRRPLWRTTAQARISTVRNRSKEAHPRAHLRRNANPRDLNPSDHACFRKPIGLESKPRILESTALDNCERSSMTRLLGDRRRYLSAFTKGRK